MGLLDFVVHKGTLFTNNEIELLDKHFIDISKFTDNNFNFHQKYLEKDVQLLEAIGVNRHEINYRHKHFKHKEIEIVIQCLKYNIKSKDHINELERFYNKEIPEIKSFPGKLLFIEIYGAGFFHLIEYDNNGNINDKNKRIFDKNINDTFISLNL
mgnify:FL=1|tara:strand:- start:110 stop:574 length:465 start_codon:yes stop_codon:yes gene_type:complete